MFFWPFLALLILFYSPPFTTPFSPTLSIRQNFPLMYYSKQPFRSARFSSTLLGPKIPPSSSPLIFNPHNSRLFSILPRPSSTTLHYTNSTTPLPLTPVPPLEKFQVVSRFAPSGDQPEAIKTLTEQLRGENKFSTLKGITGSGKSFVMVRQPPMPIYHPLYLTTLSFLAPLAPSSPT